tara:strand:+ start:3976 stop:5700 length:1725 start_codon:yes stop_codon:yes gene_type:complete
MSSSFTNSDRPVKCTNVIDPRLEALEFAQKKLTWGIYKGAEGSNAVQQQANSYSTSGITWNFNTQSENVLIDRRVYARAQFQLTFVGTAPIGQPLLNTESDAPRFLPLASVTQSLKVTINGSSVETQYSDALAGLMRYNLPEEMKEIDLSMSPAMQDKYQRYQDGVGSVRNPLSNYQNSGKDTGRGAFQLDSIVNPVSPDAGVTAITAVVQFTVTEPLLISPMLYKSGELQAGLLGVKNMGVQFNFAAGQLARVWSRSPSAGVTITSVTPAIGAGTTTPPSLLVNYLTPPQMSQGQIPRQINYQYYKAETFVNDMNVNLAPNASQTFNNNAIQLSTVPKCIYIYASRPNSTKTHLTTDTFFRINSLSLNYLNVSGQFSSMSLQDLYQMCAKNGCNLSWTEWSGRAITIGDSRTGTGSVDGMVGSVIKLDVSDLHIPSTVASGMNVNSQLSYSIGVENVNQVDTIGVQITTVIVYEGLMTIEGGSMQTQIGVISESDVIETRQDRDNFIAYSSAHSVYGGSLFSKLGHLASSAKQGLDFLCNTKKAVGMGGELLLEGKSAGASMSRSDLKKRMFK